MISRSVLMHPGKDQLSEIQRSSSPSLSIRVREDKRVLSGGLWVFLCQTTKHTLLCSANSACRMCAIRNNRKLYSLSHLKHLNKKCCVTVGTFGRPGVESDVTLVLFYHLKFRKK